MTCQVHISLLLYLLNFGAELYKERMNRQHPIYRTSNGEYGQVPKGVKCELKPPEHTQSQAFSKVGKYILALLLAAGIN